MFDSQDISWAHELQWLPTFDPKSPVFKKSVLITGGSGAFGQAFVKRCLDDGARRVVVFSRCEAKQASMKGKFPDERMRYFVGDVRDSQRISDACRGVDIVIHAAALKRVETCEENPNEAVATNIIGSQNVQRACIERNVSKAVLLSTDKASIPNTIYGATKMAAERLWVAGNVYAAGTDTRFSATRYGNVLGSTGSVVPVWKAQAKELGGIKVTDPDMTRFWMPMGDAVDLVMLALKEMRGGEVFIPKIGSSSVGQLAHAIAPNHPQIITGSRPGEKMHETLISEEESRNAYDAGSHYILEPETRSWGDVPPLNLPKVPQGFEYKSSTSPVIPIEKLRELAA